MNPCCSVGRAYSGRVDRKVCCWQRLRGDRDRGGVHPAHQPGPAARALAVVRVVQVVRVVRKPERAAKLGRDTRHQPRGPRPYPPELTALLQAHLEQFGTAPDGRIFTGERNPGELPKLTIVRAWQRARAQVLTEEVAATPLARTPYDLHHAAVSTWLSGGVPPTLVAEWAGHSVEVLLKIYAKYLDGTDAVAWLRVQAALGHEPDAQKVDTHSAQMPDDGRS